MALILVLLLSNGHIVDIKAPSPQACAAAVIMAETDPNVRHAWCEILRRA